jgi:hypothetical protein
MMTPVTSILTMHLLMLDSPTLQVLATWNILPASEAFPKSKVAATRALELDNSLPEAHAALGFVSGVYDWNWSKAESEFK